MHIIFCFVASLLMVQGFYGIGSFDFSFVLPWILLIVFMGSWTKKEQHGIKGDKWSGIAGTVFFLGLYLLNRSSGEWVSFYLPVSIAGGFLTGIFVRRQIAEWKMTSGKSRLMALPVTALALVGLLCEKVLQLSDFGKFMAVLPVVLLLYVFFTLIWNDINKWSVWSLSGAALFALFSATANLSVFDERGWWGWILSLFCWFSLFYLCMEYFWKISTEVSFFGAKRGKKKLWLYGVLFFCFSVGVDFIFLLAYYPGVMEWDSFIQMRQVWDGVYSNHHPWLHTMLIKFIYDLGCALFGSTNRAFALYSIFSICLLSFSFTCVIVYLAKKGLQLIYLIIVGLLYVMSPINQMYSIIMWKDIPFGACVLIFTVLLFTIRDRQLEDKPNLLNWVLFVPLAFGVCFFRSNGLYVFLGMIPFLIYVFWKQKKAIICAISVVLILGGIYKGPVFEHFNVTEPDIIESLSIPAQQIAAVIANDGKINEEQKELLSQVIDLEKVPEAYRGSSTCSDDIKDLVREKDNQQYIADHSGEFLKTWVQLFFENKRIYVHAYVRETSGYWYHKIYFPFIWATYIQENGHGIDRERKLPDTVCDGIANYLTGYKAHFDKYLSTGLYIYIFLLSLFIALRKKSKHLICYLPALGIWGTILIATPVWADLRYAYAIVISVPFLIAMTLKTEAE